MAYRKRTIRRLPAFTRRYARLVNELDSVTRRLKNMTEEIARLEHDSRALFKSTEHHSNKEVTDEQW